VFIPAYRVLSSALSIVFFLKSSCCSKDSLDPSSRCRAGMELSPHSSMMMMTFITQRGESQGKTKKERKATKSKGRGLEEGARRALMRYDDDDVYYRYT
jgi:hypothetical protein